MRSNSFNCEDDDLMTPRPVDTVLIKIDKGAKPCLSVDSPDQSLGYVQDIEVQPHQFNIILERN